MANVFPSVNDLLNGWQLPVCCEVCIKPDQYMHSEAVQEAVVLWLNSTGPTLTLGRHNPHIVPVPLIQEKVSEILIETAVPYEKISDAFNDNAGMRQLKSLPLPEKYRQKAISSMEQDPIILMNFSYKMRVIVYELVDDPTFSNIAINSSSEEPPAYQQWELPHGEFHRLWETLYFDSQIKRNLLEYTLTALLFSDKDVDSKLISCNRLIFLHGPPGTGKTSLCKALAQKLSIRLYERYSSSQLIEINAHSLFSKWYSESGKLTLKMFAKIKNILLKSDVFVCVLIDEVESLSAARKAVFAGNEPSDAIRVVNALLTQIDSLKKFSNCLVLTTSNITEAVDVAFLDRADLKQFIPNPNEICRYEILRGCISELCSKKLLKHTESLFPFETVKQKINDFESQEKVFNGENRENMKPHNSTEEEEISLKLWNVAQITENFSGRGLRKLPFQAFAFFLNTTLQATSGEIAVASSTGLPTISDYIKALMHAAIKETEARKDISLKL